MKKAFFNFLLSLLFLLFSSMPALAQSSLQLENESGAFGGSKSSQNFSLQDSARGFLLKPSSSPIPVSNQNPIPFYIIEIVGAGLLIALLIFIILLILIMLARKKRKQKEDFYNQNIT
jgi:flagellar biosynthesis/type III secretory pathway M-ring protein FliF/YscJ